MAVLPKRSLGPSPTRKKVGPAPMESQPSPVIELKVPVELPKCAQDQRLKPWQSAPNTSMELISCCSSHKQCIAQGDCVEKAYHVNYKKVCSLYKHLVGREEG